MQFSTLSSFENIHILQLFEECEITHLLTDSRKLIVHQGAVFFAISGVRNDAHNYIQQVYDAGVRQFIIEDASKVNLKTLPEANVAVCKSATETLQLIAQKHRKEFNLEVLAITGSNAKTTVKEYLSQMLENDFVLVKSPKSYNSQIGVPLSVWQIQKEHELGIFEAGISTRNEMQNLEAVIAPTLGIFTNIGTAHNEGFDSITEKIIEKLKLFKNVKTLIYRSDSSEIKNKVIEQNIPSFTWAFTDESADIKVRKISNSEYSLTYNSTDYQIQLPFTDSASVENLLHCVAFMLFLKFDNKHINNNLKKVKNIAMRLELKQGKNNCYLIDDTYNNDLAGLQVALEFLEQQKMRVKKSVILSDLVQAGHNLQHTYSQLAELLQNHKIDSLIGIGTELESFKNLFPKKSYFYSHTDTFLKNHFQEFKDEIILIKGARKFEFEKIVEKLEQKTHGTVLEINLEALAHNLNYYKSKLLKNTKVMAMVKAFAYGSGSYEVAHLMQFHNVDYLGVAYTNEAVDLRNNGITLPIMVLNVSKENFNALVEYQLEPEVYSFEILHELIDYLKIRPQTKLKIHLDIDTGMRRLGFETSDLNQIIELLKSNPQLDVASIYSHLVGADEETHDSFSLLQIDRFSSFATEFEKKYEKKILKHICNSAGIVAFPKAHFDMVRLGVGLYGVEATQKEQNKLRSVSTLKSVIAQIKHIKKGETVGYGRRGIAEKDTTIATINIGYADGYSRAFSRGIGKVIINGKKAPIIGNVCMDMCMIDITNLQANVGDTVILFGEDLSIIELAESINTIAYEILTNVSERVKRVFYVS